MKFYRLSPQERRKILVSEGIKLSQVDNSILERLNNLSENVVGQVRFPLSVVKNLIVNNKSYWVPMSVEEPSVVAAANHGANIFAKNGGILAHSQRDGIYGQIVLKVGDNFNLADLKERFPQYLELANTKFSSLVRHGGGVRAITARQEDNLVYLKVLVDPAQAMGANKTNSILEFLSQKMATLPNVKEKLFAILSNYPSQLTTANVKLKVSSLGGLKTAQKIALLSKIGNNDPYRAVTNNKGIMNGVDSVLIATGNDYRGVEAATAVLASESGQYRSLSSWQLEGQYLLGKLTLPLAIGTVGGSISAREDIQQAFSILKGVNSAELANIIAGVGLANNLAALLAISTKGIQAGHMKLQARNIVASLKATEAEREVVLAAMIKTKEFSQSKAEEILLKLRKKEES
ncbi:hydroxymethylglutaryl-CoA reductase [Lactobacillus colini]|uniref:Hydroxymethylglutaryl-CoA reductase n=1 Tax=Lactobacillus colini TaxID=1819254 RepID=A0ABS4MDB8_9LACO|nr:hydroxymethylglutaryl-CoA reductase [Lactobacillus colini]MBP2057598.1 hydroxymethylglutaryl-CoA reductase [Lactobacillus colini]